MHIIILLLLLGMSHSAHAEVYKCRAPSKPTVYQSTPCSPDSADKNIVDIPKLDTHQIQEAEERLKATEAERQALDKAEQARQEAAAAKWQAEAPQRAAAAAMQEAAAARQDAAAARQEAANNPYPIFIPYPYPYPNYNSYNPNPVYTHRGAPYIPTPNLNFSPYGLLPNPATNPSFSPYSTPYPPTYMPAPVFPNR